MLKNLAMENFFKTSTKYNVFTIASG